VKIRTQILLLCGCLLLALGGSWCEQHGWREPHGSISARAQPRKYIVDENGRRIYGKVILVIFQKVNFVIFQDDDGIEYVVAQDRVKESRP
jgi:hypothetical protein